MSAGLCLEGYIYIDSNGEHKDMPVMAGGGAESREQSGPLLAALYLLPPAPGSLLYRIGSDATSVSHGMLLDE